MVVKNGSPCVKPARVRRPLKSESLAIEVMAKFVAERAQEGAGRSDLLSYGSSGPDANRSGRGPIIAKKLQAPTALSHADRPRRQRLHPGLRHAIKFRRDRHEFSASLLDRRALSVLHDGFDGLRQFPQAIVLREFERREPIALVILRPER